MPQKRKRHTLVYVHKYDSIYVAVYAAVYVASYDLGYVPVYVSNARTLPL